MWMWMWMWMWIRLDCEDGHGPGTGRARAGHGPGTGRGKVTAPCVFTEPASTPDTDRRASMGQGVEQRRCVDRGCWASHLVHDVPKLVEVSYDLAVLEQRRLAAHRGREIGEHHRGRKLPGGAPALVTQARLDAPDGGVAVLTIPRVEVEEEVPDRLAGRGVAGPGLDDLVRLDLIVPGEERTDGRVRGGSHGAQVQHTGHGHSTWSQRGHSLGTDACVGCRTVAAKNGTPDPQDGKSTGFLFFLRHFSPVWRQQL